MLPLGPGVDLRTCRTCRMGMAVALYKLLFSTSALGWRKNFKQLWFQFSIVSGKMEII